MKTLLAAALLTATASAQTILFSDSFDRADSRNLDAALDGITDNTGSPLPVDGVYAQPFVDPANESGGPDGGAINGGGAGIFSGQLQLAEGSGTSNALLLHSLTQSGTFSVSIDITAYTQTSFGQGGGFALGMSQAEALATGDAMNGGSRMTGGFNTTIGDPVAAEVVSDFWVVLRGNNSLAWGGASGTIQGVTGLASKTGTVRVDFTAPDFNAGSSVAYEVFFDGASQGSGTFTWSTTGENHLGIDARDSQGVFFDNLAVTVPGPPPPAAALEVSPASVAPNVSAKTVTLQWSGTALPAGASYEITADQAVTFPGGDSTGSAAAGSGTVSAVVNGTLGDTTFTLDFLDGPTLVASAQATVRQQRPNVILIMTDDMGFSDFGCYGSEIHTPTIDSLASNGIRYRNFYNTARCSTTRCALLSGLYTHQVGDPPGASLPPLRDDNNVTIAELLSTSGYRRYMTGKWHLGTGNDRSPIGRGFQHIFGQTSGGSFPHNQVSGGNHGSFWNPNNFGYYSENNEIPEINYASEYPGTPFHQTTFIGEYALRFLDHHLEQEDGAPFFLYMPFNAVHWDINAPNDMADRYTDVADPTPDGLTANGGADGGDYYQYEVGWDQARADRFARQLTLGVRDPSWVIPDRSPSIQSSGTSGNNVETPAWSDVDGGDARRTDLARRMALYAAMLQMVDENIGKVTAKLETEGLLENTLIFIIADNGGNYEGGLYGKTAGTNNAAPVTATSNPSLLEMGQASHPDLHLGGGWANVNNTPFRLYKHFQHEGGIRSPCIVHYPAGITSPDRWIDDRAHLIDIMATISDVTGTPYPATFTDLDENNSGNNTVRTLLPLEGQSLKPHFDPATVADFPERSLGFEHESNRAWFKGDYKFVTKNFTYFDNSSPADELELYKVSIDPTETNNLATEEPELLAEMIDEWNAWATRVGVPSGRLIVPPAPQVNPAPLPTDLFVDTFNRDNSDNHDASITGMSGALAGALAPDAVYWDSFEGGSTEVFNLGLLMASGSGMTETALQHNFTDPAITTAGGFSVQVRIDEINSSLTDNSNRYAGIAVGLSAAEAQASADIGSGTAPFSFRGNGTTPGTADFVVDLDIDGNVKCWSNGTLLDTTPTGQTSGTLLVCYEVSSFSAGAPVTVSAFLDGRLIDLDTGSAATTRSFTWDAAATNHIGLTCRASNSVRLDNLAIRTLPLSATLASEHALGAGLSGADSAGDADPDGDGDDNFTEWLKNGDPAASDAGTKLLALSPSPDGEFRFNYVRVDEADKAGLSYTFRYSTDLAGDPTAWPTFTPEPISSQALGDTHELRLVGVPSALLSSHERLFILIEVE